MKKILIILTAVLISFAFFSCSKKSETYFVEPFEATVKAESGETVLTGKFRYASPSAMCLTVTEPENVKNLTFAVQDGTDYILLGSMKTESVSLSCFPVEKNVIENLFKSMDCLQKGLTAKKDGTVKLNCGYAYGNCMITFNTKTQRIERIDAGEFKYSFLYDLI